MTTPLREGSITSTVDLDARGLRHGHLRLPHSSDESAWGVVAIPITVARGGEGPTALLTGGNHGDEYEGPLALLDLARSLRAEELTGRVIVVPFMNHPAVLAGRRTSPLDGGNMNRAFPGHPDGTATQRIADHFTRVLLPRADLVLDIHSGGRTLDFVPLAASHVLDDPEQSRRCEAARDAFGAPWSLRMREIDAAGMYDDTAEGLGKTFVTTELGGGGTSRPETLAIARRGLRNVLVHAGIVSGRVERSASRRLVQPDDACFHFAPEAGLIEHRVALGDTVERGDGIARIWDPHHCGRAPCEVMAQRDGVMVARHHPGLVRHGDCVAVLAVEEGIDPC